MKTLIIRRHAQRTKPGQNLSQTGINLAKRVTLDTQHFDLVATANIPRAIQTAIAFGHEVTMLNDALGHLPKKIFAKCGWTKALPQMSVAISNHKSVANFARTQANLWKNIAHQIPNSGHALIISHGAIIELGMLASLPDANHKNWGPAIGYCEGIRLTIKGNIITGEILRVPSEFHQVQN